MPLLTPLILRPSAGAPLTPDRDQARELLEDELRDPAYERESGGHALREVLRDLLEALTQRVAEVTGIEIPFGPVLILVLIAAVILIAVLIVRPRLQRGTPEAPLEAEPGITAEELRARAEAHLQAGSVDEAFRDLFRAVVRAAEERELLPVLPGRTATEAADELAAAYGAEQRRIRLAAELFNLSRYGGQPLRRSDVEDLRDLDRALQTAEPTPSDAAWSAPQVVAPR